ncbi:MULTISPECIES: hypothetical protein [unclassified Streptomyces]|uniref:hypothetical protein n=1 Tax=unclassified Streptomyces TaxID=2593676 RepID=UPI002DDBD992|nr:hypothetical protein [Streptomyces sp. NBC_00243]WRZ25147.1 hypothetical protein OHT59_44835 [Streptomyces sp. NBC_00243]
MAEGVAQYGVSVARHLSASCLPWTLEGSPLAKSTIRRWLSRLRPWRGSGEGRGLSTAEEDPLAPLVETAKRLEYGAGRFDGPEEPEADGL